MAPSSPLIFASDSRRGVLTVSDGETVVLLGPSGAGKTRWIRSLLGLEDPFERTELLGRPVTREVRAATLGWVPQGDGVFLSDTVWANVVAPRFVTPCDPDHARDALDLVGLADRASEPVGNLGFGGRRRVALARAVARRSPVLIVDGGLDPTLWQLFPAMRAHMPWLRGVLATSCVADEAAWRATSVGLVTDAKVICQAPMGVLAASRDPNLRNITVWVQP